MNIERRIDGNGAITDIITLTNEESAAIDRAHEIVSERFRKLGIEMTPWEKEHLEYALLGRIRFDGVEGMIAWARMATIAEGRERLARGYC